MARKPLSPEKRADRALCPVAVAATLGLKVNLVAGAMRAAGVTTPVTVAQARAWKSLTQEPPPWMVGLMADAAARAAGRVAAAHRRDVEDEHRMVLLADQVAQKLLAGRTIRGDDREFIAADLAFRAMKELVRADGDVSYLNDLDLAALRWAGVVPQDRSTWFLDRGGR
ncbi:hypothetical protein [Actinoplanes sp. L3-i22]|uniref:hypothetical protein n=1 Tax=Actinoplanes sp. L3-i22 TaxID=2836373 RepID=UPI001C7613D4|nr:hypothetical protein [Actinoplanes sp. L3-i22]BCY09264.1 hypothetical protein L3i22_043520 [Actinoplanes sp. L3-i22]